MPPARTRAVWLVALLVLGARAQAGDIAASVTTPAGLPLADAAVVLEPLSGNIPGPRTAATIAQRDRELIPHATIVQTGTAIEFPNHDPFKHHLYSFSPAKVFEIKLYLGKPAQPVVFDKPGEVALGCNIHDWMEAYVLVVDSPYFAKTGVDGHARIANVPPGSYRLKWWHPRQKRALPARILEVGDTTTHLTQVLDATPRTIRPRPPVDQDTY
jgi:plastocyanin